ncbi:MAG: hypothetical protein NDI84_02625 [Steroidobacteraceae bacterium]|nr:hypothetical protein [Steroidobacteraceae bacterium]
MNVFEFLLVIVSIVLGLGITELLAGLVRILRGELVPGRLHALWMFVIFQLQVQLAWGLWGLRAKVEWQYPEFLLLLLAPVLLYLAAAVIFPKVETPERLDAHLIRRRRPFFLLLTGYVMVAALYSWLLFDEELTLIAAVIRLPAIAILATLAITERPRVHLVLGLVVLALQLWFTYVFTFVVDATAAAV